MGWSKHATARRDIVLHEKMPYYATVCNIVLLILTRVSYQRYLT